MNLNYCYTSNYNEKLLERALNYSDRFSTETAFCEFEQEGRLITLYGINAIAADLMEKLERMSRRTLLTYIWFDFLRMKASFESQPGIMKTIFEGVPLFRDRDWNKYPKLRREDMPSVKEELKPMEILPLCGDGRAKRTNIDATAVGYKMYDMIFIFQDRIIQSFQNIEADEKMLNNHPEKRIERYQRMLKDYQKNERDADKLQNRKEWVEHISQHGCNKESLMAFLSDLEHEATNHSLGIVAELNKLYLNELEHISFIYDNRHTLKPEQIMSHLRFVNDRTQVIREIELYELKQPAVGAYSNLFTSRAAYELANLLKPIIAIHVDFEHDYQYAAYAEALKESGLTYKKKRNGSQIIHYVNATFSEQIDKSILSRFTKKSEEFKKIEDQYRLILSIFNQALGCESIGEINYFQNQGKEFFERLETLKKVL